MTPSRTSPCSQKFILRSRKNWPCWPPLFKRGQTLWAETCEKLGAPRYQVVGHWHCPGLHLHLPGGPTFRHRDGDWHGQQARPAVTGHNIPEEHERTRAELAAEMHEYLAHCAQIQDCSSSKPPSPRAPKQQTVAAPDQYQLGAAAKLDSHAAKSQRVQRFFRAEARALFELVDKIRAYFHTSLSVTRRPRHLASASSGYPGWLTCTPSTSPNGASRNETSPQPRPSRPAPATHPSAAQRHCPSAAKSLQLGRDQALFRRDHE